MGGSVLQEEVNAQLKISFGHTIKHFALSKEQVAEIDRREKVLVSEQTPPFAGVEDVLRQTAINVIVTHKDRQGAFNILRFHGLASILGIKTCLFQSLAPGADYYLQRYHDFESVVRIP